MPVPDYQELMHPLLKAAAQRETSVPEIEPLIGEQFFLTRQEREQILPSGRQRVLPNRLHWANSISRALACWPPHAAAASSSRTPGASY